ncbi:MAG: segregation/condensation protein A [Stutzerimonas stutzeri]|nr:MAG: segregation/condensation protein A [Stutzerimonas stutzeri]
MADSQFSEDPPPGGVDDTEEFVLDLDGYEGPLDLLLDLARRQKVDLARISILELVDQYLAFIDRVRMRKIELAADYLVMASWLAFLKSKLILPKETREELAEVDDLATKLALRLQRLAQVRQVAQHLLGRDRLGLAVFPCGQPATIKGHKQRTWDAELVDVLQAYAQHRQKKDATSRIRVGHRVVWSLVDAKEAIHGIMGEIIDWTPIEPYLEKFMSRIDAPPQKARATVKASTLSAMLEMVREGVLDLKQDGQYGAITVKRRAPAER